MIQFCRSNSKDAFNHLQCKLIAKKMSGNRFFYAIENRVLRNASQSE